MGAVGKQIEMLTQLWETTGAKFAKVKKFKKHMPQSYDEEEMEFDEE